MAQKAFVVVSVISPDALKGFTEFRNLQSVEPGVQIGAQGGAVQTFVRDVGSLNTRAVQETSAAFNADGVSIRRAF